MEPVNIDEAKTRLSRRVDRAVAGEDVVIGRDGRPLARITRLRSAASPVRFGRLAGRVTVPDAFDDPLPDAAWVPYGEPVKRVRDTA
mgnify:CR=1 FL=1